MLYFSFLLLSSGILLSILSKITQYAEQLKHDHRTISKGVAYQADRIRRALFVFGNQVKLFRKIWTAGLYAQFVFTVDNKTSGCVIEAVCKGVQGVEVVSGHSRDLSDALRK